MSQLRLWAFCAVGCLGMMGCGRADLAREIGPASEPVLASLQAMGGIEAWRNPSSIRTQAVLTVYDDDGQFYSNLYHLDIDLDGRRMSVEADLPSGELTASIRLDGRSRLNVSGQKMDQALCDRLLRALEMTLHLAGGPGNFLYSQETARSAKSDRIAGKPLVRVSVGGDNSRALAYYFDSVTRLLEYVTSGADRPGGEGSIAAYTYQMMEGGRAFPQRILVTRIGEHVLLGDKPVLEVTFQNVRF